MHEYAFELQIEHHSAGTFQIIPVDTIEEANQEAKKWKNIFKHRKEWIGRIFLFGKSVVGKKEIQNYDNNTSHLELVKGKWRERKISSLYIKSKVTCYTEEDYKRRR